MEKSSENGGGDVSIDKKARELQIKLLEKERGELNLKIEEITESEEYVVLEKQYNDECAIVSDNTATELKTQIILGLRNTEKEDSLRQVRDNKIQEINLRKEAEPLMQVVQELRNAWDAVNKKINGIRKEISMEEREIFLERLGNLEKNINNAIDDTFIKLDELQKIHIQPSVDLGMTKKVAMEVLRDTDINAYFKVYNLENLLPDLEFFQERIEFIKGQLGSYGTGSVVIGKLESLEKQFSDKYKNIQN